MAATTAQEKKEKHLSYDELIEAHLAGEVACVAELYNKTQRLTQVKVLSYLTPGSKFPFTLGEELNISARLRESEAKKRFPDEIFDEPPVTSHPVIVRKGKWEYGYCEVRGHDNTCQIQVANVTGYLYKNHWVGVVKLSNGSKMYLMPSSQLTDHLGITHPGHPRVLHGLVVRMAASLKLPLGSSPTVESANQAPRPKKRKIVSFADEIPPSLASEESSTSGKLPLSAFTATPVLKLTKEKVRVRNDPSVKAPSLTTPTNHNVMTSTDTPEPGETVELSAPVETDELFVSSSLGAELLETLERPIKSRVSLAEYKRRRSTVDEVGTSSQGDKDSNQNSGQEETKTEPVPIETYEDLPMLDPYTTLPTAVTSVPAVSPTHSTHVSPHTDTPTATPPPPTTSPQSVPKAAVSTPKLLVKIDKVSASLSPVLIESCQTDVTKPSVDSSLSKTHTVGDAAIGIVTVVAGPPQRAAEGKTHIPTPPPQTPTPSPHTSTPPPHTSTPPPHIPSPAPHTPPSSSPTPSPAPQTSSPSKASELIGPQPHTPPIFSLTGTPPLPPDRGSLLPRIPDLHPPVRPPAVIRPPQLPYQQSWFPDPRMIASTSFYRPPSMDTPRPVVPPHMAGFFSSDVFASSLRQYHAVNNMLRLPRRSRRRSRSWSSSRSCSRSRSRSSSPSKRSPSDSSSKEVTSDLFMKKFITQVMENINESSQTAEQCTQTIVRTRSRRLQAGTGFKFKSSRTQTPRPPHTHSQSIQCEPRTTSRRVQTSMPSRQHNYTQTNIRTREAGCQTRRANTPREIIASFFKNVGLVFGVGEDSECAEIGQDGCRDLSTRLGINPEECGSDYDTASMSLGSGMESESEEEYQLSPVVSGASNISEDELPDVESPDSVVRSKEGVAIPSLGSGVNQSSPSLNTTFPSRVPIPFLEHLHQPPMPNSPFPAPPPLPLSHTHSESESDVPESMEPSAAPHTAIKQSSRSSTPCRDDSPHSNRSTPRSSPEPPTVMSSHSGNRGYRTAAASQTSSSSSGNTANKNRGSAGKQRSKFNVSSDSECEDENFCHDSIVEGLVKECVEGTVNTANVTCETMATHSHVTTPVSHMKASMSHVTTPRSTFESHVTAVTSLSHTARAKSVPVEACGYKPLLSSVTSSDYDTIYAPPISIRLRSKSTDIYPPPVQPSVKKPVLTAMQLLAKDKAKRANGKEEVGMARLDAEAQRNSINMTELMANLNQHMNTRGKTRHCTYSTPTAPPLPTITLTHLHTQHLTPPNTEEAASDNASSLAMLANYNSDTLSCDSESTLPATPPNNFINDLYDPISPTELSPGGEKLLTPDSSPEVLRGMVERLVPSNDSPVCTPLPLSPQQHGNTPPLRSTSCQLGEQQLSSTVPCSPISSHPELSSLESTTQSIEGVESMTQSIEGVESTTQSIEGVESMTQSIEGVESMTQSIEGVESMTQSIEGVESMTQLIEGVESMTQSIEGMESTTQSIEGVESTTQSIEGVESTTQSIEGVESTTQSIAKKVLMNEVGPPSLDLPVAAQLSATEYLIDFLDTEFEQSHRQSNMYELLLPMDESTTSTPCDSGAESDCSSESDVFSLTEHLGTKSLSPRSTRSSSEAFSECSTKSDIFSPTEHVQTKSLTSPAKRRSQRLRTVPTRYKESWLISNISKKKRKNSNQSKAHPCEQKRTKDDQKSQCSSASGGRRHSASTSKVKQPSPHSSDSLIPLILSPPHSPLNAHTPHSTTNAVGGTSVQSQVSPMLYLVISGMLTDKEKGEVKSTPQLTIRPLNVGESPGKLTVGSGVRLCAGSGVNEKLACRDDPQASHSARVKPITDVKEEDADRPKNKTSKPSVDCALA